MLKVTATMYWSQVTYSYTWEGPIDCFYVFAPVVHVVICGGLDGSVDGTQPFLES